MAINFKTGVLCEKISPVIFVAIVKAHDIFRQWGKDDLTVTSLRDSEHMPTSKHYQGLAFDVRIWDFKPEELEDVCADLETILGCGFDVVLEKTHIHIEFDPDK